jgi:hypothetical protein
MKRRFLRSYALGQSLGGCGFEGIEGGLRGVGHRA